MSKKYVPVELESETAKSKYVMYSIGVKWRKPAVAVLTHAISDKTLMASANSVIKCSFGGLTARSTVGICIRLPFTTITFNGHAPNSHRK